MPLPAKEDRMEKLFLKPQEVAETLGLGRSKTYELLASGTLPSVRIGGSLRVPASALRAWAEQQGDHPEPEDKP